MGGIECHHGRKTSPNPPTRIRAMPKKAVNETSSETRVCATPWNTLLCRLYRAAMVASAPSTRKTKKILSRVWIVRFLSRVWIIRENGGSENHSAKFAIA
jgi:hypothetical protein